MTRTYVPIEHYGVIGDMHTVALVAADGSIDWMCIPHFDSPSVFGRILDHRKGGHWSLHPLHEDTVCRQSYWPDTNVLVTHFLSPEGAGELTDFMPVGPAARARGNHRQLLRRITAVRGSVTFRMECRPAFNYARDEHQVTKSESGVVFRAPNLALALGTRVPLEPDADGLGVHCQVTLHEGESAIFTLRELNGRQSGLGLDEEQAETLFRGTVDFWRGWLAQCRYAGRWRESVHRSALALKLLTFEPTGAIVAAPTCSLPEELGGSRNWDYRYTWIRDSAFTIYALLRLGFTEEAGAFMDFLNHLDIPADSDTPLQIMYGIDGRARLDEEILDHLEGYRGSRPVRIGNGAYDQLQLDIYGELMDAVYLYNKWAVPISYDQWITLRRLVDWVCEHWRRADEGVWEVRGGRRQFVYSKLMCWVAVDRALRLAQKRSFPADESRWLRVRNEIYEDIMKNGWNPERQAFVQSYGSGALDAANLMMPLVFFLSPNDPRMLKTLDAILEKPEKGGLTANSLVYRYNVTEAAPDGLPGEEGTFNICTFWLVEALTRAGRFDHGRLEEGRLMFERMMSFANHLGLFGEETGKTGDALGNFPQAFTHLALISAAFNLDRALGKRD